MAEPHATEPSRWGSDPAEAFHRSRLTIEHSVARVQRVYEELLTSASAPGLATFPPNPLIELSQPLARSNPSDSGGRFAARACAIQHGQISSSPLELKFWRLFQKHGFTLTKQLAIHLTPGAPAISIADFAVESWRLAIYIDGTSVHVGRRLRRDRYIRQRMKESQPAWRVVDLRAPDLSRGEALVRELV